MKAKTDNAKPKAQKKEPANRAKNGKKEQPKDPVKADRATDGKFLPGNKANPTGRPPLPEEIRELRRTGTEQLILAYSAIANERTDNFRPKNAVEQLIYSVWKSEIADGTTSEINRIWDRVLGKPMPLDESGKQIPVAIIIESDL